MSIASVRRRAITAVACCVLAVPTGGELRAAEPSPILLWPEGAPGAKGNEDGDKPSITVTLPERSKATGAAVVVCPGGGYGHLAAGHEGRDIAAWLRSVGVASAVLKYRHRAAGYGHPVPLEDAQRAIRLVRSRRVQWKIAPDRIGIMGFSAGGHLASTAATHFDGGDENANDPVDRAGCRPDFAILLYPVISLTADCTHQGSKRNLLGSRPDPDVAKRFSSELQVTKETPPTFLMHTSDDPVVPVENSILFYQALRRAGVPAEMHIYARGRHGLGLARGVPGVSSWPARCADWMKAQGLFDSQAKSPK